MCSVEEVSCVAKWKDGSTFYFLGLLNHSHVQANDYEGRFRCYAYSGFYNGFHLAQSGEAKCNLPNAKEGDRIMELKKGILTLPHYFCIVYKKYSYYHYYNLSDKTNIKHTYLASF